jgi:hypothetical protein
MSGPFERLEAMLETDLDIHVNLNVSTLCCWGCDLTLVVRSKSNVPDRGHVIYAVGGDTAESALEAALDSLNEWMAESPDLDERPCC